MFDDWFNTLDASTQWEIPLTNADRCDRCGAAAKIRATLPSDNVLMFCQHHANEHEARLIEQGAVITL